MAFSPDGKTLASGSEDKTIILWDVSNRESPVQSGAPLKGHTDGVYSVAFSPDGKTLASGSYDKTVILWDVSNRRSPVQLGVPFGRRLETVRSVAFNPDGKTLVSGSGDGAITLWDVGLASWQSHACQMAGRNFTRAEWTQYMGDEPYHKTCEQWPLEPEVAPTPAATPTP